MVNWSALESKLNTAALAVFGESVTIDGAIRQGDFCEPHEEIGMGDASAVAAVPRIVMLSAEVPAAPVGKSAAARGRDFLIADARPDGRGLTVLYLEAA